MSSEALGLKCEVEEVKKSIEQEQDMESRVRTYARLRVVVREVFRFCVERGWCSCVVGSGGVLKNPLIPKYEISYHTTTTRNPTTSSILSILSMRRRVLSILYTTATTVPLPIPRQHRRNKPTSLQHNPLLSLLPARDLIGGATRVGK